MRNGVVNEVSTVEKGRVGGENDRHALPCGVDFNVAFGVVELRNVPARTGQKPPQLYFGVGASDCNSVMSSFPQAQKSRMERAASRRLTAPLEIC